MSFRSFGDGPDSRPFPREGSPSAFPTPSSKSHFRVNPLIQYIRVELKPKEEDRPLSGHPWVFANEVRDIQGHLSPGSLVEVITRKGAFVGRGVASPASKILVRLLTHDKSVDVDENLIRSRVLSAVAARRPLAKRYETDGLRLIFGEADRLPGILCDAFGTTAVLSCFSAGLQKFMPVIVETLAACGYNAIYERSAGESRQKEGLKDTQGWIHGEATFPVPFHEGKAVYSVHPDKGQKTGFYLDFRLGRERFAELSVNRRVLDVFCYAGASSIRAALAGAASVTAVDSSAEALSEAAVNAQKNAVEGCISFEKQDAFKIWGAWRKEGRTFEGILLDPPPLARSAHDLIQGKLAMRRLTTGALSILESGGFLIVSSCSHHMGWNALEDSVREAAFETGRSFQLMERLNQPLDHPVLLGVPETEYLRCLVLKEVV
jgi:23S rRNA (cytosine1962-C5)-methyltransferase